MIFRLTLFILFHFSLGVKSFGQNNFSNNNFLSLGSTTAGISFGNAVNYNGIRLNVWDKGSEKINGINLAFSVKSRIGNGVQICGLMSASENINGISIAPVWHSGNKINGFAVSFGIDSDTLNGVFIGFGLASPIRQTPAKIINGLAFGGIVGAEKVNGIAVGLLNSYSIEQKGLSISGFNKTETLHGLQIGLLNYAGNNPNLFKWLPFINFHL